MWLIKLLGGALITAAFFGVAVNCNLRLKRRADALFWYTKAAWQIGVQIDSTSAELYDIVNTIMGSNDYLELSQPFSVTIKHCGINDEDMRTVRDFFSELGMGNAESQIKRCNIYSEIFKGKYSEALAEYNEKSKLYKMLALFSGIALSIILI